MIKFLCGHSFSGACIQPMLMKRINTTTFQKETITIFKLKVKATYHICFSTVPFVWFYLPVWHLPGEGGLHRGTRPWTVGGLDSTTQLTKALCNRNMRTINVSKQEFHAIVADIIQYIQNTRSLNN